MNLHAVYMRIYCRPALLNPKPMFKIRAKQIAVKIMLFTCISTATGANDTDSLVYEDLQLVKKRINLLLSRLNEMNQSHTYSLDSIFSLSGESLEGLKSLEKNIGEEHGVTRDSIHQKATQLQKNIEENQKKNRQHAKLHFIFHGLAIGLIIFLIFYLRSLRQKSLQYLISRAGSMEVRQDEILQKANELEEIRQTLEKTRKQQKKLRKRIKKSKK